MNKRDFTQITRLYSSGVSTDICASAIVQMAKDSYDLIETMNKFYMEIVLPSICDEVHSVTIATPRRPSNES